MTTNLEKYLGIKLYIQEELNPYKITYLNAKAHRIAELVGFNANEFFVYIHNLSIQQRIQGFFAPEIPISKRIHELEITFDVNPKQLKRHQIKFYNAQHGSEIEKNIHVYYFGETKLIRIFSGAVIEKYHSFNTELITYISKSVRRKEHRKIKITAQGYPTDTFYQYINNNLVYHETKIDLHLDKDVNLLLMNLSEDERKDIENSLRINETNNTIKLKECEMDPITLISIISSSLNVIDKFVTISEKFLKKPEKPHSVETRKINDTLQILQNGHVTKEINASQLKLNHWDQIRFNTLKTKVDRNWRKYNIFDERLPIAPISEKANLQIEMDDLRKELCQDFREMIKIFEVTLGTSLSDHYSLYNICSSEHP